MTVFVSGSLAYDRIMDFPGRFSDHILPEKVHLINISFTVNGMVERFGGTAGNIAYALALLGERPIILATLGQDCQRYLEWLRKKGISTQGVKVVEQEFTACAYITTDLSDNQITGFNPGAMKYPSAFSFDHAEPRESLAIVAPGNLKDMMDYPRLFRARGIPYIFDPGQSLPMWKGEELKSSIEGSEILISNDYELELTMKLTGLDKSQLLQLTGAIITTRGELGSLVCKASGEVIPIPTLKTARVVDPTGAGDAYRGGLIKGLLEGKDIEHSALMGAACASFAIECQGTQEYSFTPEEFQQRLEQFLQAEGRA